jgi:hypothetical protein
MQIDLAREEMWSAPVGRDGIDVKVSQGTVWITQESDPEDHVLQGPAEFEAHRGGKIVLYALTPAHVEVVRPWPEQHPGLLLAIGATR